MGHGCLHRDPIIAAHRYQASSTCIGGWIRRRCDGQSFFTVDRRVFQANIRNTAPVCLPRRGGNVIARLSGGQKLSWSGWTRRRGDRTRTRESTSSLARLHLLNVPKGEKEEEDPIFGDASSYFSQGKLFPSSKKRPCSVFLQIHWH